MRLPGWAWTLAAAVLFAAIIAALASSAHARDEARLRTHIDWIVAHSDLRYSGEPLPLVLDETPRGLMIAYYGMQAVLDAEASADTVLGEIEAIYNHHDRVIFVSDDTPAEKLDVVLVHELVHYLQDIGGIMEAAPCLAATERQAYKIQAAWQDAHDDPNERPDPFTVIMLSICPENWG